MAWFASKAQASTQGPDAGVSWAPLAPRGFPPPAKTPPPLGSSAGMTTRVSITSAPALAAAMRETHRSAPLPPFSQLLRRDALVPMYQVEGAVIQEEAEAAARVLGEVAERLYRLRDAYAEWNEFDASAYFDLTTAQSERLVRVVERVSTVHVIFYADLLLPSFQMAEQTWAQPFHHAYYLLHQRIRHDNSLRTGQRISDPVQTALAQIEEVSEEVNGAGRSLTGKEDFATLLRCYEHHQERLIEQWQRMVRVIRMVRAALSDDIGFWTTSGAEDERVRWRLIWRRRPAPGLDPRLRPDLPLIPSLTLSIDFPLPIDRQPGRLRRLRLNRDRRRRWRSYRTR